MTWVMGGLIVLTILNLLVSFGTARNVARIMEHEAAKMDMEKKQWHAMNVTYRDAMLSNQAPLSDGVDIPQLR